MAVVWPIVETAIKVTSWDVEEEAPVVRSMFCVGIITRQEVEILLRLTNNLTTNIGISVTQSSRLSSAKVKILKQTWWTVRSVK